MSRLPRYRFRLYITDHTHNSVRAVANLAAICREYLPDRHEIDVVDILKEPKRALADGILMTPTLVKLAPAPAQRIVGTLSDPQTVLEVLGLDSRDLAA